MKGSASSEYQIGVNIQRDHVFPPVLFDQISEEARDLIKRLLVVEPEQRLSSEQILRHPWLQVTLVEGF